MAGTSLSFLSLSLTSASTSSTPSPSLTPDAPDSVIAMGSSLISNYGSTLQVSESCSFFHFLGFSSLSVSPFDLLDRPRGTEEKIRALLSSLTHSLSLVLSVPPALRTQNFPPRPPPPRSPTSSTPRSPPPRPPPPAPAAPSGAAPRRPTRCTLRTAPSTAPRPCTSRRPGCRPTSRVREGESERKKEREKGGGKKKILPTSHLFFFFFVLQKSEPSHHRPRFLPYVLPGQLLSHRQPWYVLSFLPSFLSSF